MMDGLPVVLLVEDDALVRMMAADHLQEVGFQVLEAATADDALQVLQGLSDEVDLLFSDVEMPGTLDGVALAERVETSWPHILLVLCSGKPREAWSAFSSGAFIPKPYAAAAVARQLRGLLARPSEDARSGPAQSRPDEPRGVRPMSTETRELYASPNGDRWYLACEAQSHQVYVLHVGNAPSGGHRTRMELGEFLGRASHAPEQQALSRLIGTLAKDRFDFAGAGTC